MTRKEAREAAFKLVFERVSLEYDNPVSVDLLAPVADLQSEYIRKIYKFACENFLEFSEKIEKAASRFELKRIYKVDLALIILALVEINFIDDVPQKVAINEVLELAKIYSSDKSSAYINGILGKILSE